MKSLIAIVMMQLKDKIDFSFAKDKKQLIIKTVLAIVKFVVVTAIVYFAVMLCRLMLGLFNSYEIPEAMTLVIGVFFLMSVISCTVSLVKTMYYSDDNKVLVTFPVSGNIVFVSKLLVFYFYELKRNFSLLVPILLGFGINLVTVNSLHWSFFLLVWFPFLAYSALPVLIGALLSIPALYIYRFFSDYRWIGYVLFALLLGLLVYGTVSLIAVIPADLDLPRLWPAHIRPFIQWLLSAFEKNFYPFALLTRSFLGERNSSYFYCVHWKTVLFFFGIVGIDAALFGIVFLTTRNLFYAMMLKSFEFNKDTRERKVKNVVHGEKTTYFFKEAKMILRSRSSTITLLAVGIAMPVLVFFMNKIFAAINTSVTGNNMSYAFNLLVILLPVLASNAAIASGFSREGRAGYIKKTKPVNPIIPLTAKLVVPAAISSISLTIASCVFSYFNIEYFGVGNVILLALSLIFVNLGHVSFSATLDLMNPKNEDYATSGDTQNNPNENISTLVAFVVSALYALISFKLFGELKTEYGNVTVVFVKLAAMGFAVFACAFAMYALKIKAYYFEK